jgi:hypothetical protein
LEQSLEIFKNLALTLIFYDTYTTPATPDFASFFIISHSIDLPSCCNSLLPVTMGVKNIQETFAPSSHLQQRWNSIRAVQIFELAALKKLSALRPTRALVHFLQRYPIHFPTMVKSRKKPMKGTPPVVSSLLLATSGGSLAPSSDPEMHNINDIFSKNRSQKPVNARSDTGSPATKKRTESWTLTLEINDAKGADDQDSLEDADRLDLDNSDFLEESMLAIMENRPDTEIPEDLEKPPAQPDEIPAYMMETEKGHPMTQSME